MMLRVSFLFNFQNLLKKKLIYMVHFALFRGASRKREWRVKRVDFSASTYRDHRVCFGLDLQYCFLFEAMGFIACSFSIIIGIFSENSSKCNRQRFLWNSDGNYRIYIDDIRIYNSHGIDIRSLALHGFDGMLSPHAQAALGWVSK